MKNPPVTIWKGGDIPREVRECRNGHKAAVLWFTGYSGSGKSTITGNLEMALFRSGCQTILLDGDDLRHGLCGDLGFSARDRSENIRRAGEIARLLFETGNIVLGAFISPFRKDRDFVRSLLPEGRFFEVHVKCDLEVCKKRDPRGLYKKALAGEICEFTGITSPYEEPEYPDITVQTDSLSPDRCVDLIMTVLKQRGIVTG